MTTDENTNESTTSEHSEKSAEKHHEKSHAKHHAKSHAEKKVPSANLPIITISILALIALIVIVVSYSGGSAVKDTSKYGTVDLEFYVMSQCPYGTEVEDAIAPVLKRLGNSVNFTLNFIGTYSGDEFKSLHGQPEVDGNRVQLCAIKYNPDTYMDMVVCMNKNARSIPGNWEACAKETNMNVDKIKSCYEGSEGKELLKTSFDLSQSKRASGSPTMFLNGASYNGGRDTTSFLKAICANLQGHPECEGLPACSAATDCVQKGKEGSCVNPGMKDAKCEFKDAPKVPVVIINDKRCGATCNTAGLEAQLLELFPGLVVTQLDYATAEGKKAYDAAKPGAVPALLFDESVKSAQSFAEIQNYFVTTSDKKLLLRIGATFDPSKEICDNNVDDTGNGKVDCEDADCSGVWKCVAKTSKPTVELFVMSHCPFGTQIEKGMLPVLDTLGSNVDFQLKFVNYAMHGKKEIDEQLRQYCIQKEFKAKLVPYLYCFLNSTDQGSEASSKACITKVGIDSAKVDSCVKAADTEFGITAAFNDKSTYKGQFASFNIYDADNVKYGIQGSPGLIINGAEPDAGRDAQSLLTAICSAFDKKPAACSTDLTKEGTPSSGFGFNQAAAGSASADAGCGV